MAGKKSEKQTKKKNKMDKYLERMAKKSKREEIDPKIISLERKQKEIARVVQLKTAIMMSGSLSYLEYNELREELMRLNNLDEVFKRKAAELRILSL